jgi:hypothetical protein
MTPTGPPNALAPNQIQRPASAQPLHSPNQPQQSTPPDQQQRLSQSDNSLTSQTIRPPTHGQISSESRPMQASVKQPDTSSNLLAEWVQQRIQRPQLHQQDRQQVPQRLPQQYRYAPLQLHPAQGLPTPPQSSNPLNPLMQGSQPVHQPPPDDDGNGSGTPVNHGTDGPGKLAQQINNAMHQQSGQGQGNKQ